MQEEAGGDKKPGAPSKPYPLCIKQYIIKGGFKMSEETKKL